jgi:transcriptional regulator with XRE-family HTH domain
MKSAAPKRGPSSAAKGTMRSFASRLRVIRERRKLTQKDLAQLLGTETALVSRYERGLNVPSAATIIELGRVLQVTTDELLTGQAEAADAPAIRNATLFERFRQLDAEIEDRKEIEMIVGLLDAFLAKKRMQKVLSA